MSIKVELLKKYIADYINNNIENFEIDTNKIANTVAINMLSEIQNIIKNENYSDFDVALITNTEDASNGEFLAYLSLSSLKGE